MRTTPQAAALIGTGLLVFAAFASSQQEEPPRGRDLVTAHDGTNFPLAGKHRYVECSACHLDGVMEGTPATCEACHWVRKQDDPFRLYLGDGCGDCHTPQAWTRIIPGSWSHEGTTGWALEGAHRAVDCTQCHRDARFILLGHECASCHERDYLEAREPDHLAAGYSMACEPCHVTSHRSWAQGVFQHRFLIDSGPHRLPCSDCHFTENYFEFSCTHCHAHSPENADRFHAGVAGFLYETMACYACHPTGRWP